MRVYRPNMPTDHRWQPSSLIVFEEVALLGVGAPDADYLHLCPDFHPSCLLVVSQATIFSAVSDYIYEAQASGLEDPDLEASRRYFGSLLETMLSLFMTVTDGVSWEKIVAPLSAMSLVWTSLFLFYVAFTYFAVLNVLTGVFCQSAIESAQQDHATAVQSMIANKEAHLIKVRALFNQLGNDENAMITYRQFEDKINSEEVREYFETLGLNVWDAWSFFKLLDKESQRLWRR
eukprot:Skav229058  [mRNA]  locus=scaffold2611:57820:64438:+ [translate_table: standard]